MRIRRIWDDYGLSITLILMFLAAWASRPGRLGRVPVRTGQHGQLAQAFGDDGYIWNWAQSTSRTGSRSSCRPGLHLTTFLVHRSSRVAGPDYDAEAALRRIEAKVDALEKRLEKG